MIGKGDVITEDESADENVEGDVLQFDEHADVDETETVEFHAKKKYKSSQVVVGQKFPSYIKEQLAGKTTKSSNNKRELRNGPSTKRTRMSNLKNQECTGGVCLFTMANMARENECHFLCLLMSKNEVKYSSDLIAEGLFAKKIEKRQEFREIQKLWNSEMDKLQEARMLTRDWQEQKKTRDEKIKELKKSNRLNSSKNLAVNEFSNLQEQDSASVSVPNTESPSTVSSDGLQNSNPSKLQAHFSRNASTISPAPPATSTGKLHAPTSRTVLSVSPVQCNATRKLPSPVSQTALNVSPAPPATSTGKLPAPTSRTVLSVSPVQCNATRKLPSPVSQTALNVSPAPQATSTGKLPAPTSRTVFCVSPVQCNATRKLPSPVSQTALNVPSVPPPSTIEKASASVRRFNSSVSTVMHTCDENETLPAHTNRTAASPTPSCSLPPNTNNTWIVIFKKQVNGTIVKMKFPKFNENQVGKIFTIKGEKYICSAIEQKGLKQYVN